MARFSTSDGTKLNFEVHGTAEPTLVLVHGWCSNLRHWDAQVERFAPDHRVVALDRRGHGRSDVADGGYTIAGHASDIAELLDDQALTSTVVVAHAGGGPAGLELARVRPELVRALILVDSRIGTGGGRALDALIRQIDGDEQAFRSIYRSFFTASAGRSASAAVADAARTPNRVAVADLRALEADSVAIARQVRQPVLWLTAEPADRLFLERVLSDVSFAVVPDAGHFLHLEAPAETNDAIAAFLESVS